MHGPVVLMRQFSQIEPGREREGILPLDLFSNFSSETSLERSLEKLTIGKNHDEDICEGTSVKSGLLRVYESIGRIPDS